MYREIQHVRDTMTDLQIHVRSALLGEDTRDMTTEADTAQAMADQLLNKLNDTLRNPTKREFGEPRIERNFVQAAAYALNNAVTSAQGTGIATNVQEMRSRLVDFKTHVDFAEAYLRAALGVGEE